MKIIFLGTNGWYTNLTGNTACVLVDSRDHYVVFDAGNGIYKLDKYITEDKPISLFISHFHIDHVSGLHTLAKFSFKRGIDVYVGEGRAQDFEALVKPPYTVGFNRGSENIEDLKMEVRLHEVSEEGNSLPFPVSAIELFHAYRNHGFRVTLEDKVIAYSGDCGINEKSGQLAKNAEVLIHECSYLKSPPDDKWGHVDAIQAANLAKDSGVKKLILTHFDPTQYTTLEHRKDAEMRAKEIFENTQAAQDDLIISV